VVNMSKSRSHAWFLGKNVHLVSPIPKRHAISNLQSPKTSAQTGSLASAHNKQNWFVLTVRLLMAEYAEL
jgi:hypothetical protein